MDKIQIKYPWGRMQLTAPALIMGAGLALIFFGAQFVRTTEFHSTIVIVAGLILLFIGGTMSAWVYLRGEKMAPTPSSEEIEPSFSKYDEAIEEISNDIKSFKTQISAIQPIKSQPAIELTPDDKNEIIGAIKENLPKDLSSGIFEELLNKSISISVDRSQITHLRSREDQTNDRLRDEIAALSRRGNLNLIIGVITTILAVGLLAYIVLTAEFTAGDTTAFLKHYVPRITVAVFIEVFSFFFLRLYRQSLSDIKYFQNEMTNVDSKFLALEGSLLIKDREATIGVLNALARTERNFVLQKGESTVELEKIRYDKEGIKNYLETTKGILNLKGKKS